MGVRAARGRSGTVAQGADRRRRRYRDPGDRAAWAARRLRRDRRRCSRCGDGPGEAAMMRLVRAAWVIARRDFTATVLSKAFIFFLLGPLFPLLLGGVFGGIGARVASQTERPAVAVIATEQEFAPIFDARQRLATAMDDSMAVQLVRSEPERDLAPQQKRLLTQKRPPVAAVLSGGLDHPQLTGGIGDDNQATAQLRLIIADARSH